MKQIELDFEDVNQVILLTCAFRWALGSSTYAVSTISDIIKANWGQMGSTRRKKFKEEISQAMVSGRIKKDTIDFDSWNDILALGD